MVVFAAPTTATSCSDAGATNSASDGALVCMETSGADWDPYATKNQWEYGDGASDGSNLGFVGNCSTDNKGCTLEPDRQFVFDVHNSTRPAMYFIRLSRKTTGSACRDYEVTIDIVE
jgi:hypothetical protein